LEPLGIKVKTFNASNEALNYLNQIPGIAKLPSLIILDYNMPKINGEQVLHLIKSNKSIKNIPVVMYSTSVSPLFKKTIIDLGAIACFTKAFTYAAFCAQVILFKDLAFSSAINNN
jgi:CheY-like chemotaxis protein